MFNKITVTEENFEKILTRLQKICNKYKMIKFYKVFKDDNKEEKQYRHDGIRVVKNYKYNKEDDNYKKKNQLIVESSFLNVSKHHFREAFETKQDTFHADLYEKMHSLIHIDMSASSALVLSIGDKIRFLPFGIFNIWTDDDYTRFENPLTIYKETFIPYYFKGKIKDLNIEVDQRKNEWNEEEEWWIEQDRKEMEREMEEDYIEDYE